MSQIATDDDIRELEALAAKCEQETQVFLGFRNVERAAAIRRVLAELAAHRTPAADSAYRKFRDLLEREWVRALRSEAKSVGSGELESESEDEPYLTQAEREALLRAIADALESSLPPE